MSRFLLGVIVGAAGAYMCSKKMDKQTMDKMCDSTNRFFDKAKKKFKDGWDKGRNQVDYLADRTENMINEQK